MPIENDRHVFQDFPSFVSSPNDCNQSKIFIFVYELIPSSVYENLAHKSYNDLQYSVIADANNDVTKIFVQ